MFEYYQLFLMLAGFFLALYSTIANDVIQAIGTFLSSNMKRARWLVWIFTATVLTLTMLYGYFGLNDLSFGRLDLIPEAARLYWWHLIPPLVLVGLTLKGIPASTTFLLLSVFSSGAIIGQMVIRSFLGYIIAFGLALLTYSLIAKKIEDVFIKSSSLPIPKYWIFLQWGSTSFLWSQWLMQNTANIVVFLPRSLSVHEFFMILAAMVLFLGLVIFKRGGKIQNIVMRKTNTTDIRSATIIDFVYGLVLFGFLRYNNIPISTTAVFIGLLAGREIALHYRLKITTRTRVWRDIYIDVGKLTYGLIVSFIVVLALRVIGG